MTTDVMPVRRVAPANTIQRQDEAHSTWCTVAPADCSLEEALAPNFLYSKHRHVKPHDRFEIAHADHRFLIKGYVVSVDADAEALVTYIVDAIDLTKLPVVQVDWGDAVVAHDPGHDWHIRLNNRIAKARFSSEEEAQCWLAAKRRLALEGVLPRNRESNR